MIRDFRSSPKPTQKSLSVKYGVGSSTVCEILQKADTYLNLFRANAHGEKKRFDTVCKYERINSQTWEWFQKARQQNCSLSGPIIQAKAAEIAVSKNIKDFKSSNGWLASWKSRYSIKSYASQGNKPDDCAISGEETDVHAISGEKTDVHAINGQKTDVRAISGEKANVRAISGEKANVHAINREKADVRT